MLIENQGWKTWSVPYYSAVRFADGEMTADMIKTHLLTGTESNDTLTGYTSDDVISGNGGNDTLLGLAGNDELIGGAGNDRVRGGTGDDVYLFGYGDGQDTVVNQDSVTNNGYDVVRLREGVRPDDVVLSRGSSDLIIALRSFDDRFSACNDSSRMNIAA